MVRDRVVLVTGAASGIGAGVCRALAGPGCAILVHTRRNQTGAEAVADAVRAAGGRAEVALGDLADPAVAEVLVADTVARFGALDVLVSNAGFADRTGFAALSDEAMARQFGDVVAEYAGVVGSGNGKRDCPRCVNDFVDRSDACIDRGKRKAVTGVDAHDALRRAFH